MQKINFQNLPSTATPINATNLNAIQTNVETAINDVAGDLSDYVNGTTAMGNIRAATLTTTGNINFPVRKYDLTINSDYIYSEDLSMDCFRIGQYVILTIKTIAFKVNPPNFAVLVSGLPTPKYSTISYLTPGYPGYNRARVAVYEHNLQTHWSAEVNLIGDHANNQYFGTFIYETSDN